MNRLPHIAIFFAAVLLFAADKKPEKAEEPALSAEQIRHWIKQLGDESFKVREEATRDLLEAGRVALDAVTKATKSEDAEVRQRALMIIKQINHLEKAAIAYFKKLGGRFTLDEKSPGKHVIGIDLRSTKITDAGLVHLKWLLKLRHLNLRSTQVTDSGLVHLKGLANLNKLHLGYTKATKAGIEKLRKALPNCKIAWHEAEDAIVEYLVKQSGKSLQIVPPPENIAHAHYKYARMYKKSKDDKAQVYALIATHTEMARQLFKDNDPNHRRYGLDMISNSVGAAIKILDDPKLASRMCDTFLWPNLDFAHKVHWKYISRDDIVRTVLWTYEISGEDDKSITAYKYLIEHPSHDNALGWTLLKFSFFHKKRKRYQEALYYLEKIPKAEMSEQRRMWIASLKKIIKENKEKECD